MNKKCYADGYLRRSSISRIGGLVYGYTGFRDQAHWDMILYLQGA